MSNFRTTADLLDGVLRRCGEMTSDLGTSPLQAAALLYLNQIHNTVITGGNELEIDVDESWIWAKARRPVVLNLNPPVTAGSVSLTQGSTAGTFSTAPQVNASNASVEGWYLKPDNGPEIYRIIQHTSGLTAFTLDANFPQASYAGSFHCFQLEYDLIPSKVIVDNFNDKLDFISKGTTSQTAALTHGSYDPATYATTVAAALTSADTNGNTYTGSYDSVLRTFSMSSNLGGTATAIFTIVGNGTNYARSGWQDLGFDFLTTAGSASYTGAYPFGATAKLFQAARLYYGFQYGLGQETGQVCLMDPVAFDRDYPLIDLRQGTPDYFKVTGDKALDGKISVQFNKYPAQNMRVEFEHVMWPKDLQNNAQSIPRIPRKFIRMLEFGASYYLLLDKGYAEKAATYLALSQQMLKGMMKFNRSELQKVSKNFGAVIARPDMMPEKQYRRLNIYGYDSTDS